MSETFIAPKKYELVLDDFIEKFGRRLFRIRALSHFGNVSAGELGGYIEQEANLSHSGSCWVYEGARVLGNAEVLDNAQILGNALVSGRACVSGEACVSGDARVLGNAKILEQAWISENAQVLESAQVFGKAWISGYACVSGKGQVSGRAHIAGNAHISGHACVSGKARVWEQACVSDEARVSGHAHISGHACVSDEAQVLGAAQISGNAKVSSDKDFIDFFDIEGIDLTVYRTQSGGIEVAHRAFCGTPEAFLKGIAHQYGDEDVTQKYRRLIEFAQSHLQARRANEAEENMIFDNLLEALVKLPDSVKKQALRDAAQGRSTNLFAETYERLLQAQTSKALQKATEYARYLPLYKS